MENTNIFQYKVKPNYIYKTAFVLVAVFWALWFNYYLFGTISVGVLSAVIFISSKGLEIDFENNRYREGRIAGKVCTGKWQPLPNVKYISVFKANVVSRVSGRSGAGVSSNERVIKVNLIHGKNGRLTVYQTPEKEDAFEKACLISEKLNLKILDATTANHIVYDNAEAYCDREVA